MEEGRERGKGVTVGRLRPENRWGGGLFTNGGVENELTVLEEFGS